MKIFKNKFFVIAMALAVFFAIFALVLSFMGQTGVIKNTVNSIALPFRYAASKIAEAYEGFGRYFESVDELLDENESLKQEIDRLEGELADADAAKDENARLREYIEVKRAYPDFKFADALIVGREGDGKTTFLTLDVGKGDGIDVGMAVIVKQGVVGSVCEVGSNWCRVRVITENSSGVGAFVQRSGEIGIISGDVNIAVNNECRLEYLDVDADVEIGDLVYTSGMGSVYPRGLFVGRVVDVGTDTYLRKKYAVVKAAVDADELTYVMIITDHERQGSERDGEIVE